MDKLVVTGVAGFIGSTLTARLLESGKNVVGIDNFSTGSRKNIEGFLFSSVSEGRGCFTLLEGDICDMEICSDACQGASVVFHHAAQISVPYSVEKPSETFIVNSGGFLNILEAARINGCRVVYASSSAVYGDLPELPKSETSPTAPLSPYALSKLENEQRASMYWKLYGVPSVGLRYFNIYGPRQNPRGAYAAVIPAWEDAFRSGKSPVIYGDGSSTRDFCFVEDVVEANLLAATTNNTNALGMTFNIATGKSISLLELYRSIQHIVGAEEKDPIFSPPRLGDIPHSAADITKARIFLGYSPQYSLDEGLRRTIKINKFF